MKLTYSYREFNAQSIKAILFCSTTNGLDAMGHRLIFYANLT